MTWMNTRFWRHAKFYSDSLSWGVYSPHMREPWSCAPLVRLLCVNTTCKPSWSRNDKKYVLSNSESVQCNFFIFDHVTFIQFKFCCCVQNFIKIGWFFTDIWRYNDFQNGGRPPPWSCFTTIWDHPRRLCCWSQLPVKFHVNLIHRSEASWTFGRLCTPKYDYSSWRP